MKTSHLTSAFALAATVLALGASGAFAAVTVNTTADLMAGPGQNFKTVARLQADTNVTVTATNKDWCKVDAAGTKGWIACSSLDGMPVTRVNTAPKATTGYDFQSDPYFGPTVAGGNHTVYNGEFH
jgi:uncharacterized protein YraI